MGEKLMKERGRIVKDQNPPSTWEIESIEFDCVSLHISTHDEPLNDENERLFISAPKEIMETEFPELTAAWKTDKNCSFSSNPRYLARFPVSDFVRTSPLVIIRRLLESNFLIAASSASAYPTQRQPTPIRLAVRQPSPNIFSLARRKRPIAIVEMTLTEPITSIDKLRKTTCDRQTTINYQTFQPHHNPQV